ncbi:leucine zipper putative tumor suppressor 1-like [Scyliorhinus canicula]|uniref:leucine zipper putative tumor suppressor 1-like n=1 Tax=Scyliorhinus canicula TaxID=7830 RepID=UPI0018F3EE9A|nr:leucine zipper putative tumor suppressor 1-like [Scyliorhinus canicula]XP_038641584.1 leucine zipper putative tumor suppressor 1-like [Scyliorhinus canicula]
MGSVSSLILSQDVQDKQSKALDHRNRMASQLHKLIRQQDGLLKLDKGPKTNSKCERTEDFFYISISQTAGLGKVGRVRNAASELETPRGGPDIRDSQQPPATPALVPGQLEKRSEKSTARLAAFKKVASRIGAANLNRPSERQTSGKLPFQDNVHPEKHTEGEQKTPDHSEILPDSGQNSMASLPTDNPGYSHEKLASANLVNRLGGSARDIGRVACSLDSALRNATSSTSTSDSGHCPTSSSINFNQRQLLSQCPSCTSTDRCDIQGHEEGNEGNVGGTLADKGKVSLSMYKDKQEEGCRRELDSVTQTVGQPPQKVQRNHYQLLQLQLIQLQQDKTKLQDDFNQLLQERNKLSAKCESYQREQAAVAPKLEETKWEICQKLGEISLLKQQLRDSQAELTQKVNEVLSLKAQLREAKGKLSAREAMVDELRDSVRAKERELGVCENEQQRVKNTAEVLREKVSQLERQMLDLKPRLASSREAGSAVPAAGSAPHPDRDLPRQQGESCSAPWREELAGLQAELEQERLRSRALSIDFHQERLLWRAEQQRVMDYQKKLQQTYSDVLRHNHSLERAMQQLATELKAREPLDGHLHGTDIYYEEIVATAI